MDERRRRRQRRRRRLLLTRLTVLTMVLAGIGLAVSALTGGSTGSRGSMARAATRRVPASVRPARLTVSSAPRLHLPATLPARTLSVPILMYHRVDYLRPALPAITRRLTVDPHDFAAQMTWLRSHGFHALTQLQLFDALERGARLPAKPVLLTFDDGYRDIFGRAMPVLRRLHLHGTAYVITGRISGPDPSFLTWGQLSALERHGIEIGSHTVHHLELPLLSDRQALQELLLSRHALERHLGHPVQWFAYPAGAVDARAVELVRRAGYVLAVTTMPGSLQSAQAPLELHRYEILDSTGVTGLAGILGS